jgi:hypothetical protein
VEEVFHVKGESQSDPGNGRSYYPLFNVLQVDFIRTRNGAILRPLKIKCKKII